MTVLPLVLAVGLSASPAFPGTSLLDRMGRAGLVPDQARLNVEASAFAEAWGRKDTDALVVMMAERGIRLHLPGEEYELLQPRRARATLQVFLHRYATGEMEINRTSPTGGGSREGFAEILWTTGSPGSAEPVIFSIFVGYELVEGRWAVTEIRVLF